MAGEKKIVIGKVRGKTAYEYAVEGGYTGTEAEFAAKLAQEKFANPNALTFTGAVTGSYDGSAPLTVEIPSGGGGDDGKLELIVEHTITEDVSEVIYTEDEFPGIENLRRVIVHIVFPERQTTGWWKAYADDTAIISCSAVSNVWHYYGVAEVISGDWFYCSGGSSNNSGGQSISRTFGSFSPNSGYIAIPYQNYRSIAIRGNNFTLVAGTVVRIWGALK